MRSIEAGRAGGCLLIGDAGLKGLREGVEAHGVRTRMVGSQDMTPLITAQEMLFDLRRRDNPVAIAAEGELWPIAIALAEQVQVDRIALIEPMDVAARNSGMLRRMNSYARAYLSLCVSEILVVEAPQLNARAEKRMNALWRGMCNARIHFLSIGDKPWPNCEQLSLDAIIRFLSGGEFNKPLAK